MFQMNLEFSFAKTKKKIRLESEKKTRKQAGLCSLNMIALHGKKPGVDFTQSLPSVTPFSLVSSRRPCQRPSRQPVSRARWRSSGTGIFHLRSGCGGIKELFIFISVQLISPPVIRASSPSLSPQGLSSHEGSGQMKTDVSAERWPVSINNICSRYSCFNGINLEGLTTVLEWITDHTREWFVSDYGAVR